MLLKYLIPLYNVAEAAGAVAEAAPAEPVANADPAPAADPASHEPAPSPAPQSEPSPWYLKRISQESAKANEATAKLAAAERRAAEAEALAERLRAGREAEPAAQPTRSVPESDRQAEVRREAERLLFFEDTVDVKNRGVSEFGAKFGETLNILTAVGATSDDFIADVLAVDKSNAHVLLDTIAKDPERAVSLSQMTSRQRIAELTRMSVASSSKAAPTPAAAPLAIVPKTEPKGVSRAPAPPPRIEATTSQVRDGYADDATDDEFTAQFNARMKERAVRR